MNSSHNKQIYSFVFLLFIVTLLGGCVDLSGTQFVKQKTIEHHGKPRLHGEVHTMRGAFGIFSLGMNQLNSAVIHKYNIKTSNTMWYDGGYESRFIIKRYNAQKKHGPIILIGHSLGANEQIKVARNLNRAGVPVELLITVDAVSQTLVPPNVKRALNIYKPGILPMLSGLKLRAVNPSTTHIDNVNVATLDGVKVNHFTIDKDKILQYTILEEVDKVLMNGNKKDV